MSVKLPKISTSLPPPQRSEHNKRHLLLEPTSQKCVAAFLSLRDIQSLGLICIGQSERVLRRSWTLTPENPIGTAILPSIVASRYTLAHPMSAPDFLLYSQIYNLRSFPEIQSLTFYETPALVAKIPEILPTLPNLRNVCLEGADRTTYDYLVTLENAAAFEIFKMMTNDFEISECLNQNPCVLLKDQNLSALKNHNLTSFELRNCILFTGIGLNYLKKDHLQTLKFERCNFEDPGMQILVQFPLHTLKLGFCTAITSAGWALLSKLSSLEHLDLTGCDQLTDDDILHIARIPKLKTLNLSHCTKITDDGLQCFDQHKFTSLNLIGCTSVSPEAFTCFHTA